MLSIIETILTLVLTALATLIAVLQFKNERRKTKEEESEKQRLEAEESVLIDLVACTDHVDDPIKEFDSLMEKLIRPESQEMFVEATKGAGKCLKAYGVALDSISPLYERLLINEEKFPLSRGFERYINAFREFLITQERHERAWCSYTSFRVWICKLYEESSTLQEKDVDEFNNRLDAIFDEIDELNKAAKDLLPYIEEIRLKYKLKSQNGSTVKPQRN